MGLLRSFKVKAVKTKAAPQKIVSLRVKTNRIFQNKGSDFKALRART